MIFTIRYIANTSSDHHPNHVPGMLIIINPKHPTLPICSIISTNLLFHLFSKPSLIFNAYIIFGIIIISINITPNMLIHSIVISPTDLNSSLQIYHINQLNTTLKYRMVIIVCKEIRYAVCTNKTAFLIKRYCHRTITRAHL